jgi:hypothetical protein
MNCSETVWTYGFGTFYRKTFDRKSNDFMQNVAQTSLDVIISSTPTLPGTLVYKCFIPMASDSVEEIITTKPVWVLFCMKYMITPKKRRLSVKCTFQSNELSGIRTLELWIRSQHTQPLHHFERNIWFRLTDNRSIFNLLLTK